MNALVALLKLCHKLLDALSQGEKDEREDEREEEEDEGGDVVPYLSNPLSTGNSGGLGMNLGLDYLHSLTKYHKEGNPVASRGDRDDVEDTKGLMVGQLLVLLEFVFEILESRSFHIRVAREIDRGETDLQSEFLEFSEQCLQVSALQSFSLSYIFIFCLSLCGGLCITLYVLIIHHAMANH